VDNRVPGLACPQNGLPDVAGTILKVAVGTPLNQLFDYLPADNHPPLPGQRVRIPFGRREQTAVIVALADHSEVPANKLRKALEILDAEPLLDEPLLQLLQWAARYYQHPPGEVFAAALPTALRQGAEPVATASYQWQLTQTGSEVDTAKLAKTAKLQALLLGALSDATVLPETSLRELHNSWRKIMASLSEKGWAERELATVTASTPDYENGPTLTDAQAESIAAVPAAGFNACLLEGVTGSGKTEVYLGLIEQQISAGRQSLVLVPEIGLTPQLLDRFERRVQGKVVAMHSGLTDTQRLQAWIAAHDGTADVIIGTRSAIFIPLPRPGLIVIDEEHDGSYKQQDGFRYSARDLAVYRARQLNIPIVLGSATPAFETLNNALEGRYKHLHLPERPGSARQPDMHMIDLRHHPLHEGLSQPLVETMQRHLQADGQVLIYLNRRGFAPTLLCPSCGVTQECKRCDARMVLHQRRNRLVCHHCGAERAKLDNCPDCQDELVPVGHGTERLEQELEKLFPDYPLVRIDRDTTRRRGSMEAMLKAIRAGESRILLGTQMLTKGHDFPNVTLVGIIDSDQGLFGTDFRSGERLAQSILQVSGRAGRGDRPGEVWIQTWYPDHPLLKLLLEQGYDAFAAEGLAERRAAAWPPFSHIALLRAESAQRDQLFSFLAQARACGANWEASGIRMLGPASSPMEKRSGRYRGQLLIQSPNRGHLGQFLLSWRAVITQLPEARKTRWSLDVDPVELF
jgi:primosomal protein N' (replication factor Y)